VSSRLIVKDIAQTVFRCAETIKKTSSANINTVAHRQKYQSISGILLLAALAEVGVLNE